MNQVGPLYSLRQMMLLADWLAGNWKWKPEMENGNGK